MSVPEKSGHGWLYNWTAKPVVKTAGGIAHVWRALVRIDGEWRTQRNMAPFPVFRWAVGVGILTWTATGTTPHTISAWFNAHFPWLIVAGALTLAPEVARLEFGGLKMELLRETREDVKALTNHLIQLQIQQAAASSNASAGISQTFTGMQAVTDVTAATKQGEETRAVPAQQVNWDLYTRSARHRTSDPPGTPPSTATESGRTVKE